MAKLTGLQRHKIPPGKFAKGEKAPLSGKAPVARAIDREPARPVPKDDKRPSGRATPAQAKRLGAAMRERETP